MLGIYVRALPRLLAEENVRLALIAAVGANMGSPQSQEIMEAWRAMAAKPPTEDERKARQRAALAQFRSTFGVQKVSMFPQG